MSDKQIKNRRKRKAPKTAFKPGISGNPKGRPKKELCIPDILRKILDEPSDENKKVTKLNAIMIKVVNLAIDGEKWSIEYLSDRTEGKALDHIEVEVVETFFDLDKLKGVKDADIRTVIKILRKIRTESGD